MIHSKRTNSEDSDFKKLVILLDQHLAVLDGEDHAFYSQFDTLDNIKNVVVCYHESVAIGCGSFKEYNSNTVEIKRIAEPLQHDEEIFQKLVNKSWLEEKFKSNRATAVAAELGKAEIVEQDEDDVRRRLSRVFAGRPVRHRLSNGSTDGALESFVILHPLPILPRTRNEKLTIPLPLPTLAS